MDVPGRPFNGVSYTVHSCLSNLFLLLGGFPDAATGRLSDNIGQRLLEPHEPHRVLATCMLVAATFQNGDARFDTRVRKPAFGGAFQDRDHLEIEKYPPLQLEPIFHVEPLPTGEESEVGSFLHEAGGMRPEIAMQVGAPGKFGARKGVCHSLGVLGLIVLVNFLLPHIRRIPDDRIERRKHDRNLLAGRMYRNLAESSPDLCQQEIPTIDTRIIRFVVDLAGGEVERCEVRGVERDITPKQVAQHGGVRALRIHRTLAIIRAYQK